MRKVSKIYLALSVFAMVSCGEDKKQQEETITIGGDKDTEETTTTTAEDMSSDTTAVDGETVELEITGNDQMQFNKKELRVKAGQKVKLTLKHVGEMPENVMGHNWVLLKKGTDIADFGQKAVAAADNEYIPENTDQVIVHTELIGGGETTTIEFTAPAAGTYDFICSFPGHYAIMQGKFIVE